MNMQTIVISILYSAIKRFQNSTTMPNQTLFQFYIVRLKVSGATQLVEDVYISILYSAIKSTMLFICFAYYINFNSI